MRSKPDDGLRALFVKHLAGPKQLQAVELGMTSRGVPDLYYCLEGATGWIELKATKHWGITLRPSQIGWLLTHTRHGGRAVIAVRRRFSARQGRSPSRSRDGDAKPVVVDELYLLRAQYAPQLRKWGLRFALQATENPSAVAGHVLITAPRPLLGWWAGGPRAWDWAAVRAILRQAYI